MLWVCQACTTAYSVGAPACPQCGADDHVDEGARTVEIAVNGGEFVDVTEYVLPEPTPVEED